ncbi:putative monovalent cation/H+ antiporter subunit A [Flavobacterium orientale]|uniref:Na(+)/H(+) antiporter subunit A n=1 Tax=Flavobacterium orientale TaxID=1756020 RepID=A0A916Y302_9FLAO|nr:putative monovalent cation/H+ antiporter subunit A [Flavobacterium orientale]GGD27227.1 Na(+)/H(+) antiporter subunit A [Flavobacterium orientale]
MIFTILLCVIVALFLIFFGKKLKGSISYLLTLLPLSLFVYFTTFIGKIAQGEVPVQLFEWVPSMGIHLSFRMDGLALLFSLLITGIGTLVYLYTSYYLKGHTYLDRFYGYLSIFMGAMLGLVLSDSIMGLFIFWELTSISSFFLIGFNNHDKASRTSALQALAITGFGGLFLLGAAILFGFIGSTYSIQELIHSGIDFTESPYYVVLLVFIFIAAFTKSAQFPFHFWLPGAMKAPTPVSTYLHSATMVKAGIYLLLRFTPLLGNHEFWNTTLFTVGAITMLYAAFHTLFRTDLKGILAYSTISVLGILVFLIGIGTSTALHAALVFIVVHALYKAALFLITGILDHETGTRNVTKLSGLKSVMMPVAIAGLLAMLSNAGMLPSFGFVGKDLIYEATLQSSEAVLFTVFAVVTNILLLYAGYQVGIKPFIGTLPENFTSVHLPDKRLWMPPLLLGVLGMLFGLFPSILDNALFQPSLNELAPDSFVSPLKLWHGFTFVLLLSIVTIALGLLLVFVLQPSAVKELKLKKVDFLAPKTLIRGFANGFQKTASLWTNFFQNGYLRNYILTIILFLSFLIGYYLIHNVTFSLDFNSLLDLTIYEVSTLLIMVVAVFYAIFTKSRLAAVAAMGVVGYAICMIFVFYSAPDLAMTQFTIDTLTVILFVLVLYRLPKYLTLSDFKTRVRDGFIAVLFGSLITILSIEVLQVSHAGETKQFYAENSYVLAKGKNIVNVILVDFRGLDTMVEITVLVIAALGVFGLLKLRIRNK